MRGSAALPVVVPAGDRDLDGLVPCSRERGWGPGAGGGPGTADPPAALRPPAPAHAPAPPAGGTTAGSAGGPHAAAGLSHSPGHRPPATRYRPFGVSSPAMGALTGPEPAQGGPGQASQPEAANDRDLASSPAGRARPGKAAANCSTEVPRARPRVKSGQAPPGGGQRAGHSPRYPAKRRTAPGGRHYRGSSVANCAIFDPQSCSRRRLRKHMFYLSRPFCRFRHGGSTSDPRSRAFGDRDLHEI
jgi:hypothetical protein